MNLKINGHSPIPIRLQLMEQLRHAIEAGGVARDQALPSIRELAGFLGVNPNTVARVIDDLKRSGYVEARRGKGVFVAPAPGAPPPPPPPPGRRPPAPPRTSARASCKMRSSGPRPSG
jgi:DNA-binding transcriptional regulator YhcF (GntR family)